MAELATVSEPVVSFVVRRVGELIIQEAKFLKGVEGQVQQLQTELELMQCFLQDAHSRREDGDETVSMWVSRIREAAYDAEDVIETFVVKVAFRRRNGFFNVLKRYACIFKEFGAVHEVGLEIEAINAKITTLTRCLQTYGIQCRRIGSTSRFERQQQLRRSYSHVDNPDFVGFKTDMQNLVKQLLKKDSETIVCLWGMGGLGKTTLAKEVYNHSSIKQHFQYRAWAYISQQCNPREVWKNVLFKLLTPIPKEEREEIEKLQHQELAEKLSKFLSENKCLVILDDIWEAEAWESLKPAFPETNTVSKFLLTTRNDNLFQPGHPHHILYPLRKLTDGESWELFTKKISRIGGPTGSALCKDMVDLGQEMVKHCEGLPLGIVVLGGILGTKQTLKEWQTVSKNVDYYLNKGHGHEKVTEVLALSYEDLPYHLKACFLYLSHFPEDHEILPHKLVQMWIAEDIVSMAKVGELLHNEEQTLMDVGMSYLNELVQRSMVEVQLTRFSRRIKFYKLHDLMRDLCIRKAQEENFSKVICLNTVDDQLIWANSASSPSSSTVRRIALHYLGHDNSIRGNVNNIPFNGQERTTHHHVRACLFEFFGNYLNGSGWQQIKSLIKGLKLARVLDIQGLGAGYSGKSRNLPREMGNLIQLRYFSIRRSNFAALPYSVGNLQFLQTLDLACWELRIPNVLWRLKQLRHLYLPKLIKRQSCSMGKLRLNGLRNLETLESFNTEFCNVRCFSELPSLRRVRKFEVQVKDLGMILHFPILEDDSDRLQPGTSFCIGGDCTTAQDGGLLREFLKRNHIYELTLFVSMETLPTQFSTNLTKLKLIYTKLKQDPMQTLQKLPNLRNLKLDWNSYAGKKMVCSAPSPSTTTASTSNSGGFPQLKSLRISLLSKLEVWTIERGAMPSLIRLLVFGCQSLREISEGLGFINTLQELVIRDASETLFDKLGDGGTEIHKVAHVPFKSITPCKTRWRLSKFLSENKCLVILDDIWEAEAWESLKPGFPETNTESKFLLTTRNNTLFQPGHPHHILYPLGKLTDGESWELFTKKISRIGGPTGSALCKDMKNLGQEMVKHCESLPLGIVVLGGILGTKHTLKEWQTVSKNIDYYLNKGHGHEKVTEVLALSYEDLPYHLKACFLYLSHFPEDYEIFPHKLVQMWIAEDIVSMAKVGELLQNEEQTLMDVGMSYLNELVQRSMVEVQLTRFSRRIKFYKLHDLMRDLCIRKAQEENFSKVICLNTVDDQLMWANSASSPSSSTIRRIALHYLGDDNSIRGNVNNIPFNGQERTTHHHVRACLFEFFWNYLSDSGWQQIKSLIKGLKLARVLDIQRLRSFRNLPREIGNLIQLRYFSIRCLRYTALPCSVGNLQFLQTLDLACWELRIPNVLWRLKQLRHLYLPKRIKCQSCSKGKLRLNGLRKLETLESFNTYFCNARCFFELPSIRRVRKFRARVKDLGMILHFPILEDDSDRLQPGTSFCIRGDCTTAQDGGLLCEFLKRNHIYELTLLVSMETLPTQFSTNLTKLKLIDTELKQDPMQTLQKLPNLKKLKLHGDFYWGNEIVCSAPSPSTTTASTSNSGGFPQLRSLRISYNSYLEVWIIERGAMPSLIRLQISGCESLREISEGLEFIDTLQELVITRASETLCNKLGDGGTEIHKVAHVPFKSITR